MVLEAETLKDVERVRRVAHEIGVPANWRLASGLLDALDAVDDKAPLGVGVEGIAVLPLSLIHIYHADVTAIEGDSYRMRESEQETAARRRKK